jgi:hypothetical protein
MLPFAWASKDPNESCTRASLGLGVTQSFSAGPNKGCSRIFRLQILARPVADILAPELTFVVADSCEFMGFSGSHLGRNRLRGRNLACR